MLAGIEMGDGREAKIQLEDQFSANALFVLYFGECI